jgi:hypothetical protein
MGKVPGWSVAGVTKNCEEGQHCWKSFSVIVYVSVFRVDLGEKKIQEESLLWGVS